MCVFEKLIALKSTKILSDFGGRKLYIVTITPAFRAKWFTNRGRMIDSVDFEIKEKATVTGNACDNGYILIDKREQNLQRFGAKAI